MLQTDTSVFKFIVAQIKSNALFRIEVNIKTKLNRNKSSPDPFVYTSAFNLMCRALN